MTMKKNVKLGAPLVIKNTKETEQLFPPGFRYRMGGIIYTVKADVTQEASSPMREVSLSDGATEIVPVETIMKDVKEIENSRSKTAGEIMDPDERFIKKAVAPVKKIKKKQKKTKKDKNKRENSFS